MVASEISRSGGCACVHDHIARDAGISRDCLPGSRGSDTSADTTAALAADLHNSRLLPCVCARNAHCADAVRCLLLQSLAEAQTSSEQIDNLPHASLQVQASQLQAPQRLQSSRTVSWRTEAPAPGVQVATWPASHAWARAAPPPTTTITSAPPPPRRRATCATTIYRTTSGLQRASSSSSIRAAVLEMHAAWCQQRARLA
jgi:hypothetical protein